MTNPQLLEYVGKQLSAGVSKDAIKNALVGQGWKESDINEAFLAVEKPAAAQVTQPIHASLIGLGGLFRSAFSIYKKQWPALLLISAVTTAVGYGLSVFLLGGLLIVLALTSTLGPWVVLGGMFAALLTVCYLMVVLGGAMLRAVSDTSQGVFASLGWAFRHSLSLVWIYILFFVLIAGGFSLLIIPGILFLIWFIFAPFVYATEGDKGFGAYFKSKEYVRGRFWSVVLRLIPPTLVFGVIYAAPVDQLIKSVLFFLVNPFMFAYIQSLYLSAKAAHPSSTTVSQKESRAAYLLVGILGLALPVVSLAFLNSANHRAQDALSQLQAGQNQLQDTLQETQAASSSPYALANRADGVAPYVNDTYHFSIVFPKDWAYSPEDDLSIQSGFPIVSANSVQLPLPLKTCKPIVMQGQQMTGTTTEAQAATISISAAASGGAAPSLSDMRATLAHNKDVTLIQDKDVSFAGTAAHLFEYTVSVSSSTTDGACSFDFDTYHVLGYVFGKGTIAEIDLRAPGVIWDENLAAGIQSLSSFKFIP